jgi:hypothetical protein
MKVGISELEGEYKGRGYTKTFLAVEIDIYIE